MKRFALLCGAALLATACGLSPNIDLPSSASGQDSSDPVAGGDGDGNIDIGGDGDGVTGTPNDMGNESGCGLGGAGGESSQSATGEGGSCPDPK